MIYSVLTSLRHPEGTRLSEFNLQTVVEEVERWWERGKSCFTELLEKLDLPPPEKSVLYTVIPLTEAEIKKRLASVTK